MGLDMYIYCNVYIGGKYTQKIEGLDEIRLLRNVGGEEEVLDFRDEDIYSIRIDAGYWRKAYAIMDFIEAHTAEIDNCKEVPIDMEALAELKKACVQVLNDPSCASQVLPAGINVSLGDSYGDNYFRDVENTLGIIKKCEELEKKFKHRCDFYFYASW